MVYSLNLLMMKSLYYQKSPLIVFIISLSIWFFAYIAASYNKYIKKMGILFLSIIGFLTFSLLPSKVIETLFLNRPDILEASKNISRLIKGSKIIEFILWSVKYMFGYTTNTPENFDILLLVIIFAFISIIFSNLIIKKKKIIYFILPVVLFIFEWFRYIENISRLFNIYAAALIVYYISTIYEDKIRRIDKKNSSSKYYSHKAIIGFGCIMVIITIFTSNVIINTLSVTSFNDKMSNIFPSVFKLRSEYKRAGQSRFLFRNTPYQPLGNRLGGSITKSNKLIMRVSSNKPSLYLRGRVKNVYTGYSWYSDNGDFNKTRWSSSEIDGVDFKKDSDITEITVYPDNILTSTVFLPYFPVEIEANKRKVSYNEDLEMYFTRGFFKSEKGSYTIKSVLPRNENGEINIIDDREIDKDKYLQLPDSLPKRIWGLAATLTKDCENDYEKMKVLEKYLAENYTYSLSVSNIPETNDFVDYFLFEDRRGYCTYYASALAVMGRTIGIPTRYVEGFLLPREKGSDGRYEVKADRAHAWVEAYIEDIGWINFEPTSSYYAQAAEEEIEEAAIQSEILQKHDLADKRKRDLERMMEEEDIPFAEGSFEYTPKGKALELHKLIPVLLVIIITLRILYVYYRNKRAFSKVDYRRYVIKNYYTIISLYSFIEKLDFERYSPLQFFRIIDKNLVEIYVSDDIIDSVNRAFYSNENIDSKDTCAINEFRIHMEKVVTQKIGRIAYFYHKCLLGDIYL